MAVGSNAWRILVFNWNLLAHPLISYTFSLIFSKFCLWVLLSCMAGLINNYSLRLCLHKSKTTHETDKSNKEREVKLRKLVCQHINKIIWLTFSYLQRTVLVLGRTIVSQLFWWRHRLKIHGFLSKAGRTWTVLPCVSLSRYLGGQGFIIFNTLLLTVSPHCSLESMRTTREIEGSISMLVFKIPVWLGNNGVDTASFQDCSVSPWGRINNKEKCFFPAVF